MNDITQEVSVLRGWSDKRMDGSAVPGEAFGAGVRCDVLWPDSLKATDYNFTIAVEGGELVLAIDTYTAIHGAMTGGDPFDDVAWQDGFLTFSAPASRANFRELARIARRLLTGRMVTLVNERRQIDGIASASVTVHPYRGC